MLGNPRRRALASYLFSFLKASFQYSCHDDFLFSSQLKHGSLSRRAPSSIESMLVEHPATWTGRSLRFPLSRIKSCFSWWHSFEYTVCASAADLAFTTRDQRTGTNEQRPETKGLGICTAVGLQLVGLAGCLRIPPTKQNALIPSFLLIPSFSLLFPSSSFLHLSSPSFFPFRLSSFRVFLPSFFFLLSYSCFLRSSSFFLLPPFFPRPLVRKYWAGIWNPRTPSLGELISSFGTVLWLSRGFSWRAYALSRTCALYALWARVPPSWNCVSDK